MTSESTDTVILLMHCTANLFDWIFRIKGPTTGIASDDAKMGEDEEAASLWEWFHDRH